MSPDEIRDGFLRFGYHVDDTLVEAVTELIEHDPKNLMEDGSGFEVWSSPHWTSLEEALEGWDTTGQFATQTDGPYIGPSGVVIAGNGGEDMLCFIAEGTTLLPQLVKWDQTMGVFERV